MVNQGQCIPSPCRVEREDPMILCGYASINIGPIRMELGLIPEMSREQTVECLTTVANKALSIIEGLYSETSEDKE